LYSSQTKGEQLRGLKGSTWLNHTPIIMKWLNHIRTKQSNKNNNATEMIDQRKGNVCGRKSKEQKVSCYRTILGQVFAFIQFMKFIVWIETTTKKDFLEQLIEGWKNEITKDFLLPSLPTRKGKEKVDDENDFINFSSLPSLSEGDRKEITWENNFDNFIEQCLYSFKKYFKIDGESKRLSEVYS
jgi:hypothetical protein